MDNPETGEVSFVADGRTFTLRYTTAAWIALEKYLDRGMMDILAEMIRYSPPFDAAGKRIAEAPEVTIERMKNMRLGFVRAVFWAGFHDNHRDVAIEQAGDLMEKIGGMLGAYQLVMAGAAAAQAPVPGGAGDGSPPRPPKRSSRRRTGSAS